MIQDPQLLRRVDSAANRLRLVQVDFADEPEATRQEYLQDEIKRALASVMPQDRQEFLRELEKRFPTWDGNVNVSAGAAARSKTDEAELKDPSFLVGRLIECHKTLSEAQKEALVARLQSAGIVRMGAMQWPPESLAAVRTKLGLAADQPIDPGRTLDLLVSLAEFAAALDAPLWAVWKEVSPQASLRRGHPLQKTLARFLSGDPETTRAQVGGEMARLRQLIAALLAAVPQAGVFAASQLERLSPSRIEASVAAEGKIGFMSSREGAYWKKYREVASAMDENTIVNEIRKAIAEFAERLLRGLSNA